MEIVTLYSHFTDLTWLPALVEQHFPDSRIVPMYGEDGQQRLEVALAAPASELVLQSRQRRRPGYELEQVEDDLTQNLLGMRHFVEDLPAENPELRKRLSAKIGTLNLELSVKSEEGFGPGVGAFVTALAEKLDAIIFASPNSVFPQLAAQSFLNPQGQVVLDTEGRSEATELPVSIDAKYFEPAAVAPDQQARKERSEAQLHARNIPIMPTLPAVESETTVVIRPVDEVVNRALALCYLGLKSEGTDDETLAKVAHQFNVHDKFTPQEKGYVDAPNPTEQQAIEANWRYESLHVLLWALGYVPTLTFPDTTCDVGSDVGHLAQRSEFEFRAEAKLRTPAEILDALDLIYRCSWACVNGRIKNQAIPDGLDGSVVYEWHYALNWLTNYQDQSWDDVRTDT